MKKWIVAVIIGVLAPFPINLLAQYLAQAGSGNIWYGYALSALIFLCYFFLGAFLAGLERLRTAGAGRRVLWPEFALGAVLLLMSLAMKLEQATGLVTANIDFVGNNAVLTQIVRFDDGLYLWVVLAGFLLTDAFQKVPAQAEGARVKVVKAEKAKGDSEIAQPAAEAAQAEPEEPQPQA